MACVMVSQFDRHVLFIHLFLCYSWSMIATYPSQTVLKL